MSVHVFVDESCRSTYIVCGAVLAPAQLNPTRVLLRDLRKRGQKRIHMQTESDSRRRMILSQLVACGPRILLYSARGDQVAARRRCLEALLVGLAADTPHRLVIESRTGRDSDDRHVIFEVTRRVDGLADMAYEHMRPQEEPLLWVSDAVAWAYGAGHDWRRRIEPLIDKEVNCDD